MPGMRCHLRSTEQQHDQGQSKIAVLMQKNVETGMH
jgi:hypothetical protein